MTTQEEKRNNLMALCNAVSRLKIIHHNSCPGSITKSLEIAIDELCKDIKTLSAILGTPTP